MPDITVGFAGMTHLGLVSAAAVSSKGFAVLGYDPDEGLIERLRACDLPVLEPGLNELVSGNTCLRFSATPEDLNGCDIVYIATDVPTDDMGTSELSGIHALIGKVSVHLRDKAILVILCQVPPGFTRALPLDKERLLYQVETLIFGRAVERATQPERYIVGCADPSRPLPNVYRTLLETFSCPIMPMRYESAELSKISINICLVASISVANTMSEICERIGASWNEIVPALKLDKRIGPYSYLAPGLGIAGGNLERDLATTIRMGEEWGTDFGIIRSWIANSRHRRNWALKTLHEKVLVKQPDPLIAVWGLAYKENTHSTKNSPSLYTIRQLAPYRIRMYDPAIPGDNSGLPRAMRSASPMEALKDADVLMVLTPWPQFRQISITEMEKSMKGSIVIDPYGILDKREMGKTVLRHLVLGEPAGVI